MWDVFEIKDPPEGWLLLEDSSWDSVIAWGAGPANVCRTPFQRQPRQIPVTCIDPAGVETVHWEWLSTEDMNGLDDEIDMMLREKGVPPRPRGYAWYIRPVPGGREAINGAALAAQASLPDPIDPLKEAEAVAAAMRALMRQPVREGTERG